ncbi:MAG: hypothetical protein PVF68_08895 [Acidobacteriota bacterium]
MRTPMILLVAGFLLVSGPALADSPSQAELLDQYLDTVKGDLTERRDAALRAVLVLSDEEAEAFWPLQKQYDRERGRLGKERRKLLKEWGKVYQKLDAETAQRLAAQAFSLDEQRTALRKKYFDLMSERVNPVVAAQFLQLEGQFETMGDLKLATYVPLASR